MRPRPALLAVVIAAALGPSIPSRAQGGDVVVARVGSARITAAEVERRLASLPPFQLRTYGATEAAIRRGFLERVLIPEALHAEHARAERLDREPATRERVRSVLRSTVLGTLRTEAQREGAIPPEDVRGFYEANLHRFRSPPRVALWRILVATREEALGVLAEAKKDSGPRRWTELARERSLDKGTSMRGGNVGFVFPDGSTTEPSVRVDPALYAAAQKVKDGELVAEPVREGERYAVVWRRGSMPAVNRTLEEETPAIRQALLRQRTEAQLKELLARLRAELVTESNPGLVDQVEVTSLGEITPVRRPGTPVRAAQPGNPVPTPTPRGLR